MKIVFVFLMLAGAVSSYAGPNYGPEPLLTSSEDCGWPGYPIQRCCEGTFDVECWHLHCNDDPDIHVCGFYLCTVYWGSTDMHWPSEGVSECWHKFQTEPRPTIT